MSKVIWHRHESTAAQTWALAERVQGIVSDALIRREAPLLAFTGGRSPIPVFEFLSAARPAWQRVIVVPTDDRLVAHDHPLSNYTLLQQGLEGTGAQVVPLVTGADLDNHHAAGRAADARLSPLAWPLDLAWLGMGVDGHTASIFQGPDLPAALNAPAAQRALGVLPQPLPPEAPVARVTLSAATLAAACHVLLSISGKEKLAVLEQALAEGAAASSPIGRLIARTTVPVEIHWSPT